MPDPNTSTSNADEMMSQDAGGSIASTKDAMVDTATTMIGDIAQDLKSRAGSIAGNVSSETANYAEKAKGAIADEVQSVASALRTAADEMSSGSAAERTFSQIANGLADASDAMRDKDLGQIVGALSDYARRNPMIFLGGAVLVGFAATRFAKASTGSTQSGNSASYGNYYARNDEGNTTTGYAQTENGPTYPASSGMSGNQGEGDWG